MAYRYESLSEDVIPEVYRTFVEAFSDYPLDVSQTSEEVFRNRALKNAVDLNSSIGVYYQDKMVGYTLVGVDYWKNAPSAFDVGTGIVKTHRGKGIAKEMFRYIIPKLRERGVKRFVLEVLQENEPAIKAYQKAGFRIVREFDCFQLVLEKARFGGDAKIPVGICSIDKSEISLFEPFLDWQPSWENSFASISRIPDRVILCGAKYEGTYVGLLVYYPALNWIMSIVVKQSFRRNGVGTFMLSRFLQEKDVKLTYMKLVNVDHGDSGMLAFLSRSGFELYTRQFEMEYELE